ncbi:PRELI domain-containing protein 2-like isoform X2 [Apostichopus japonicus]|uniref:PRELI domain-containing protein 2-like isoform X2 n=1 Tax=Stichopus japonicus TaxID=307972 RepID=UPI003AB1DD67
MVFEVTIQHVFKFSWLYVTRTHLTKYPTEKEEMVMKMDTVEENMDSDGVQYKRRIAVCRNILPAIFKRIPVLNEESILLEEECWYNAESEIMKVKSRNLTWQDYANAWEESEFMRCPNNPSWTLFDQRGGIELKYSGVIARMVEMFVHSYVKSNSWKAVHVMEKLLEERAEVINTK